MTARPQGHPLCLASFCSELEPAEVRIRTLNRYTHCRGGLFDCGADGLAVKGPAHRLVLAEKRTIPVPVDHLAGFVGWSWDRTRCYGDVVAPPAVFLEHRGQWELCRAER
ncbi:hypothetical protein ANAPC5_01096 [Anaplasma phagocytophilum]|nr:hypothetical protein ANAPC5_01096 [Anaplasma phagocytophilum]